MKISREGRIWTATVLWIGVAAMLAWRGAIKPDAAFTPPKGYLAAIPETQWKVIALALAVVIGGLKGWFVLQKSAVRTAKFIQRRPEKDWIWMAVHPILYLTIPLMIGMGWALRHFYGPQHPALIVGVYCGIAFGLLVGARGFHVKAVA